MIMVCEAITEEKESPHVHNVYGTLPCVCQCHTRYIFYMMGQ